MHDHLNLLYCVCDTCTHDVVLQLVIPRPRTACERDTVVVVLVSVCVCVKMF